MKRSVLIVVAVGLTAAWLGLAIWGEGGWRAFFSHPALGAVAIAAFAQAVVATFSEGSLNAGEREDRANRWVLVAFALIGLADGYLPAWSDRTGFWALGEAARWPGALLFAFGGALRLWPVFVLGRRFSGLVAIQAGHELVTTGVFGLVRNPSYLGMVTMTLGWGLAFRSWVGVILAALLIPPLIARMNAEERLLESQFGAQYEAYKARTWRLVPWVY